MAFGGGKVILIGEHAVVYGRPALAAGLSRGVTAAATPASHDSLVVHPWELEVRPDPSASEPLARALDVVLSRYEEARPPLRVEATTELPAGAGLGCSAALGVAVIGAIDEALRIERTPAERGARALDWEKVFHGNPSGLDNTMAAMGGVAVYRRGEPLEAVAMRRALTLVVGNSGESASTKTMVESVARMHAADRPRIEQIFDAIATLTRNATLAVAAGDWKALGQLMDLDQALLSTLMLSTERLEELCFAARAAGAYGAKLTGSGGGGCMIAVVEDAKAAAPVLSALRAVGAEPFVAEVRS